MIYNNLSKVKDIKFGGKSVCRIYSGKKQVFPEEDINSDYLYFIGIGSTSTVGVKSYNISGVPLAESFPLEYDNGDNLWKRYSGSEITLKKGKKIRFRCGDERIDSKKWKNNGFDHFQFSIEGKVNSGGSVMTLIDRRDEKREISRPLFKGLFKGCKGLIIPPRFPAKILCDNCYEEMFSGCTYLEKMPCLPALKLNVSCYKKMFHGCKALKKVSYLPAEALKDNCYESMFEGCDGMVFSADIAALTGAKKSCMNMYKGCASLKRAPEIFIKPPAGDDDYSSYDSLFKGMFSGCISLEKSPVIEMAAKSSIYSEMFSGCSSLKYIRVLFLNWGDGGTNLWVQGVYKTGTFVCPYNLDISTMDESHIPFGWTVKKQKKLTGGSFIEIRSNFNSTAAYNVSFDKSKPELNDIGLEYCIDDDIWKNYSWNGINGINIAENLSSEFPHVFRFRSKSDKLSLSSSDTSYFHFNLTVPEEYNELKWVGYDISGDIRSLMNDISGNFSDSSSEYCFAHLFKECKIISCSSLETEILKKGFYKGMFEGCDRLMYIPKINYTSSAPYCFSEMFKDCSGIDSLFNFIPSDDVQEGIYDSMFMNCTSLNDTVVFSEAKTAVGCYQKMFSGCTGMTDIPVLPCTELSESCYAHMFEYCSSLDSGKDYFLNARKSEASCYEGMFKGCASFSSKVWIEADSLVEKCFFEMFFGCSSLRYVNVKFRQWNGESNYTSNWLKGVREGGYFGRYFDLEERYDDSHIPSAWKRKRIEITANEDIEFHQDGVFFVDLNKNNERIYIPCFIDRGDAHGLERYTGRIVTIKRGMKIFYIGAYEFDFPLYSGQNEKLIDDQGFIGRFHFTGSCFAMGTLEALVDFKNRDSKRPFYFSCEECFMECVDLNSSPDIFPEIRSCRMMFMGCSNLISPPSNFGAINPDGKEKEKFFFKTFMNCEKMEKIPQIVLPVTLGDSFCESMFENCVSASTIPENFILNSKKIGNYCYKRMFYNCFSLVSAPSILASDAGIDSCREMFSMCSKLLNPPERLPAQILSKGCYEEMFRGCSSLLSCPAISAVSVAANCCRKMFLGCESITAACVINSNEMKNYCYESMFEGCVGLTSSPKLPATTLAINCYKNMFRGCTGIKTASELHAVTLVESCYERMYFQCSGLTSVPVISAKYINKYSCREMFRECNSIKSLSSHPLSSAYSLKESSCEGMFSSCGSLSTVDFSGGEDIYLGMRCYKNMFNGCENLISMPKLNCETLSNGCYEGMFSGCGSLESTTPLPAKALYSDCYKRMFQNCFSLSNIGKISAVSAGKESCSYMFSGCSGLVNPPELNISELAYGCFSYMFERCSSMVAMPKLISKDLKEFCYWNMFNGCTSLTSVRSLDSILGVEGCYACMFKGCTKMNTAPHILITSFLSHSDAQSYTGALEEMFYGCSSLNHIRVEFESWHRDEESKRWTKGVSENGTFYSPVHLDSDYYWEIGNHYPSSWKNKYGDDNFDFLTFSGTGEISIERKSNHIFPKYDSEADSYYEIDTNGEKVFISVDSFPVLKADIYYSVGNGGFWERYAFSENGDGIKLKLNEGSPIKIMVDNEIDEFSHDANNYFHFNITGEVLADGNLMCLFGSRTNANMAPNYSFYKLFSGCTGLKNIFDMNAVYFGEHCCELMYSECSNIEFFDSENIYSDYVGDFCFKNMFLNCTSIQKMIGLNVANLSNGCYESMFEGCSSIIRPPDLISDKIFNGCYKCMFKRCTSLKYAPALIASNLSPYCYESMLEGCTSLKIAPDLPATVLSEGCYKSMFKGCTSLVKAPSLPAKNLVKECYYEMFMKCSLLNRINACFSSWNEGEFSTNNWLEGVFGKGIFINRNSLGGFSNDSSHIPVGWEISKINYLTFIAYSPKSSIQLNKSGYPDDVELEYTVDDLTWKKYAWTGSGGWEDEGTLIKLENIGDSVKFKAADNGNLRFGKNDYDQSYHYFVIIGTVSAVGSINTLLDKNDNIDDLSGRDYCYANMFNGCTGLITAPELPATTLVDSCYYHMFDGCTNLTTAPNLPATKLSQNCYKGMFSGCISLSFPPYLPANEIPQHVYYNMFNGCNKIKSVKISGNKERSYGCYEGMYRNCRLLEYVDAVEYDDFSGTYNSSWFEGTKSGGKILISYLAYKKNNGTGGLSPGSLTVMVKMNDGSIVRADSL